MRDPARKEVKERYDRLVKVYYEMVGNLYPPIVYADIQKLRQQYIDSGGPSVDVPPVRPPRADGYVY